MATVAYSSNQIPAPEPAKPQALPAVQTTETGDPHLALFYPSGPSPFAEALDGSPHPSLLRRVSDSGDFVGEFHMPCSSEEGRDTVWKNVYHDEKRHDLIADEYASKDGSCQLPFRTVRQMGTYQDEGPSNTVPGARKLNFKKPKIEITLWSPEAVYRHNSDSECGKKDWVIFQPSTFERAQCTANPVEVKTINKIVGDTLYVGDFGENAPRDSEGRPENLDQRTHRISERNNSRIESR